MTDATTRAHRRAPSHAEGDPSSRGWLEAHSHGAAPARGCLSDRDSLLEASAAARLLTVSGLLVVLWTGVYWALH